MFDDLISRQAAIDALEKDIRMAKSEDGELWVAKINAQMKLTLLPSIEAEPIKRGRWTDMYPMGLYTWGGKCSCCGEKFISILGYNFCPNCGSDNREVKNEG